MEIKQNKNELSFTGVLNEMVETADLEKAFSSAENAATSNNLDGIVVNLKKLQRGNSSGIFAWFKSIGKVKTKITYKEIPLWFVEQFNNCRHELCTTNVEIESFYGDFVQDASEEPTSLLLVLGKDVVVNSKSKTVELKEFHKGFKPDFLPKQYFKFLHKIYLR